MDLKAAMRVSSEGTRVILARGEKSGHAHAIDAPGAVLWDHEYAGRILEVREPADLEHEEHGAVRLEPGLYRVRLQRQYVPAEEPRRVRD